LLVLYHDGCEGRCRGTGPSRRRVCLCAVVVLRSAWVSLSSSTISALDFKDIEVSANTAMTQRRTLYGVAVAGCISSRGGG
jgi:hypothetical protein